MEHDIDRPGLSPEGDDFEPYAKRFIRQVLRDTFEVSVKQQVITFGLLGGMGISAQYWLGVLTPTASWNTAVILLWTFVGVLLMILFYNIIRAPFILDRERARAIIALRGRLQTTGKQLGEGRATGTDKKAALRQPNLVLKRTWVMVADAPAGLIPYVLAEFKNEPEADFIVEPATVRAHVSFEEVGGTHQHRVPDGAWWRKNEIGVKFRLGDTWTLMLATQNDDGVQAMGAQFRKTPTFSFVEWTYETLTGDEYNVEVQLVGEAPSRFLGKHRFKLITRPELQIERL